MDVQPLNESRPPQHNPQGVGDVDAVHQVHLHDASKQKVAAPPQVAGNPGTTACQECGNQAKKDCTYQRCRTCCKSRDFDCPTHVKSTWVAASKRRERQAAEAAAAAAGQPRPKSKRARSLALGAPAGVTATMTTASATSPRGSDYNPGHPSQPVGAAQGRGGLPPEVRAQALFKCVRMRVENGENEFAYQATVKIGGHIFKGVLYDLGLDNGQQAITSNPGELQLGGGGGGGVRSNLPSSSTLVDPSGMYASGSALLGGEDSRVPPWFA